MDELIAQVSQRTGIPPEQARQAVQVVIEHLKGRLPAALSSHLDQFLGGSAAGGGAATAQPSQGGQGLGGIEKGIEGLFGR